MEQQPENITTLPDLTEQHYGKKIPLTQEEAKIRSYLVRNDLGEYYILYKNFLLLRRKRDNKGYFADTNFDGRTDIFFSFTKKQKKDHWQIYS